jgi:hypothetical protein
MKWTRLLLIVLMAALTFGGSFTCSYNSSHKPNPPQAK